MRDSLPHSHIQPRPREHTGRLKGDIGTQAACMRAVVHACGLMARTRGDVEYEEQHDEP